MTMTSTASPGGQTVQIKPKSELLVDGEQALHAPPGFLGWVAHLVHLHRARLLAYAVRRGLSAEDALDVVQDSFVSFLKLPQARDIAHLEEDSLKMLTVLVRHTLLNHKRKLIRRQNVSLPAEDSIASDKFVDSETLVAQAEEIARLRGCILRMAELQRRVVTLSLLDEHSHEKVASVLNISENYARVLLHRARDHMRSCNFEYDERYPEIL
jgi:RNA polymerase sigma factor (sigma-70 family)